MDYPNVHRSHSRVWEAARRQHGVVSRAQLLEAGYRPQSIKHRIAKGRLHPVGRGVYAMGRPALTLHGRWMAAVLSCGPHAALSHQSAAALWGIRASGHRSIEVSVPMRVRPRRPGIVVHRRANLAGSDLTRHEGIPVTSPVCTLIDIAARLNRDQLEAAVNEADKLGLTDPERLRSALDQATRRPGIRALRDLLDRPTFTLTDSQLERRFLPLARKAGLPVPETGRYVNGFRVDFYWPELGLVVETDGLRYHRTPAQQARDRVRDQAHTVAGLTTLRFTRAQVRFEPVHVVTTLLAVATRLRAGRP
jgi:very-short-patch-repair endonuclease/predicted transcriptional regulator of viral defense system